MSAATWMSIVIACVASPAHAQVCLEANHTLTGIGDAETFVCADLDGNLDTDVVIGTPNALTVYLSTPPSAPYNQFLSGRFAYAAADLDGDGDLDLLTNIQFVTSGLVPYMNQGNGTFSAGPSIPLNATPRAVHCADFNGDGVMDLATAALPSSSVSVLFGLGNGAYSPQFFQGVSGDLISGADLDGDGDQDLVTSTSYTGPVTVLRNAGSGTLVTQTLVHPGAARFVGCHDYDGDGRLDVLTHSGWYRNLGNGTFGAHTPFSVGPAPTWLTFADFDGDQRVDIGALNGSFANVTVSLNQGAGSYATSAGYIVGALPSQVGNGDFDGDGDVDILSLNGGDTRTVTLLENQGHGVFEQYPHYTASSSVASHFLSITSADFDEDGHPDVATSIWNSSLVSVLLNQGDGTLGPFRFHDVGLNPWNLTHGDFDGDGHEDIVTTNSSATSVSVLRGVGNGTFLPQLVYPVGGKPVDVKAADVDGDGDLDIFTANSATASVSVLINQGGAIFSAPITLNASGAPNAVVCADLDGDGDVDCVTANSSVNTLSYFKNQGGGAFTGPTTLTSGVRPMFVTAADLDGDGDQDLAAANYSSGTVSVFVNQGAGVFAPHVTYPGGAGPTFITAADIDADGDVDLATINYSNNVWILLNQGNATFPAHEEYGAGFDPRSAAIADYDGDGRKDIAVVAWNTDFVTMLLQCPAPPAGYCFGDGSGTSCPCASVGATGHGCPSSTNASGALLEGTGLSRVSNDTLRLRVTTSSSSPGLFAQGTSQLSVAFGDGLLCIGGGIVRLAVVFPSGGSGELPNPANPAPLHVSGGIPAAVGTRHYQVWYRDSNPGYCTTATFNLTNGVTAVWAP